MTDSIQYVPLATADETAIDVISKLSNENIKLRSATSHLPLYSALAVVMGVMLLLAFVIGIIIILITTANADKNHELLPYFIKTCKALTTHPDITAANYAEMCEKMIARYATVCDLA